MLSLIYLVILLARSSMHKTPIFEGSGEWEEGERDTIDPVPPLPILHSPLPRSLLRHLFTAFDQGLQIAFVVTDEDCEASCLRTSGLSKKDHFTTVIERGLSKVVECLFRATTRNFLIDGRDHLESF